MQPGPRAAPLRNESGRSLVSEADAAAVRRSQARPASMAASHLGGGSPPRQQPPSSYGGGQGQGSPPRPPTASAYAPQGQGSPSRRTGGGAAGRAALDATVATGSLVDIGSDLLADAEAGAAAARGRGGRSSFLDRTMVTAGSERSLGGGARQSRDADDRDAYAAMGSAGLSGAAAPSLPPLARPASRSTRNGGAARERDRDY